MTDRRFHAANARVAHVSVANPPETARRTDGEARQLCANAWLRTADGRADRQLLWGDPFLLLDIDGRTAFGISEKDGYVGHVPADALADPLPPTHRVAVRSTWAYPKPDLKSGPLFDLHMTSRVTVIGADGDWSRIETPVGAAHIYSRHLRPLDQPSPDPVAAAEAFLGTPYVWAGNTGFGIDCSGLVQVAFHAAGRACPPDSDLQERMQWQSLSAGEPLVRGDLVFWKGHVAIVTGPGTILHANAHHMAVATEPLAEAEARIARTDTGPITHRLRPGEV